MVLATWVSPSIVGLGKDDNDVDDDEEEEDAEDAEENGTDSDDESVEEDQDMEAEESDEDSDNEAHARAMAMAMGWDDDDSNDTSPSSAGSDPSGTFGESSNDSSGSESNDAENGQDDQEGCSDHEVPREEGESASAGIGPSHAEDPSLRAAPPPGPSDGDRQGKGVAIGADGGPEPEACPYGGAAGDEAGAEPTEGVKQALKREVKVEVKVEVKQEAPDGDTLTETKDGNPGPTPVTAQADADGEDGLLQSCDVLKEESQADLLKAESFLRQSDDLLDREAEHMRSELPDCKDEQWSCKAEPPCSSDASTGHPDGNTSAPSLSAGAAATCDDRILYMDIDE
mmetsp:Transcript_95103/g.164106  ORF Transcript_95103/g.164106 Transcript_95103/m.164106 type:complete len:342 (-) Transcript_95103:463-1488(-)